MKHIRKYNPLPAEEETLPACVKCGSGNIKTLDNWLTNPCVRVMICKDCGRMTDGTGFDIAECKANALKNWLDPAFDLPPWEDAGSLAGGITEDEG